MRKPVPGYDRYEIDDTGRVFNIVTGKELKLSVQPNGYLSVELFSAPGVSKRLLVHRLVATAFIPNGKGLPIINHKDENPQNNHVSNLEWCTHKYNVNYGHCKEKRMAALADFFKSDHMLVLAQKGAEASRIPVSQYDKQGNFIASYESARKASAITGCNSSHISECCKKSKYRKTAGGYIWRYEGRNDL